jgi:hypothetical protein
MRVFRGIFRDQTIGIGKVAKAMSVKMLKAMHILEGFPSIGSLTLLTRIGEAECDKHGDRVTRSLE